MMHSTVLDALSFSDTPKTLTRLSVPLNKKPRRALFKAVFLPLLYFSGLCLLVSFKIQDLWLASFLYSAVFMIFHPSFFIAALAAAAHLFFTPFLSAWHTPVFEILLPLAMILCIKKGLDLHHFGFCLLLLPFANLFFSPIPAFSVSVQAGYTIAAAVPLILIALQKKIKDPAAFAVSALLLTGAYAIPFFGLSLIFLGLGYLLAYRLYFIVGVFFHLFSVSFFVYHSDLTSPPMIFILLFSGFFYFFITYRIRKYAASFK